MGAIELAQAVEALGAGEILLNCIDNDGAGKVGAGSYAPSRVGFKGSTYARAHLLTPALLVMVRRASTA